MEIARHRTRTTVALAVVLLLVLPGVGTATASDGICPAGEVTPSYPLDMAPGHTHLTGVDCLNWLGVARGVDDWRFAPGDRVSRGQMATFLARGLSLARTSPETGGTPPEFVDTDASAHADSIASVAAVGIALGDGDGRFDPSAPVTRAQMASFLVRFVDLLGPGALGRDTLSFDDVSGGAHRESIERLGAAGITRGDGRGSFSPAEHVTRGQMATFLTRTLDLLAGDHVAAPPEPPVRDRLLPNPHHRPQAPSRGSYALYPQKPRWDACHTVYVVVNYAGGPPSARQVIPAAIREFSRAWGVPMVLHSETDERQDDVFDWRPEPFDTAALLERYPEFGDYPPVLINFPRTWSAGPGMLGWGGYNTTGLNAEILTGSVGLNGSMPLSRDNFRKLVLHELGHVVGLDHVHDAAELMTSGNYGPSGLGPGDREGLWRQGAGQATCLRGR